MDLIRDSLSLTPTDYEDYNRATDQATLNAYLNGIGFPCTMKLKPTVETLYMLINKHIMSVPYNNFHFHFKERVPLDLSFPALV